MAQTESQRLWYKRNRSRLLEKAAEYRRTHSEEILKYQKAIPKERRQKYRASSHETRRAYMLEYRKRNRMKLMEQNRVNRRVRVASDVQFRLGLRLRKRLIRAIESSARAGSAVSDLGCSTAFLKFYLEQRFEAGMTWENWGLKGWHIDHIKPLSAFDLTDRKQFLEACHYSNLQPLWASDNLRKGSRREEKAS